MAALENGVKYDLSSEASLKDNKNLVFVKLTDTAARAIEQYIQNQDNIDESPTVQFKNNEGVFTFPTSGDPSNGPQRFQFNLSKNTENIGKNGWLRCVQHTSTNSLESLGDLLYKLRIDGKEDIIEETKKKMATAKLELDKKCTIEIKPGSSIKGRRVKQLVNTSATIPLNKSIGTHGGYSASMMKSPFNGTLRINTRPIKQTYKTSSSSSTDVTRRPLKERLIHLLALKPYKKQELYDRIKKEGLKDKDESDVTTILQSISQIRDNTYHLIHSMWIEVQENWPFYSQIEKQILKRRKAQNLMYPSSTNGGGSACIGHQPISTNQDSSSETITSVTAITGAVKRPGYFVDDSGFLSKKIRIPHNQKQIINPSTDIGCSKSQNCNANQTGNGLSQKPQIRTESSSSRILLNKKKLSGSKSVLVINGTTHKNINVNNNHKQVPALAAPPQAPRSLESISTETSSTSLKIKSNQPITKSKNKNVITQSEEKLKDSGKLQIFPGLVANGTTQKKINANNIYSSTLNSTHKKINEVPASAAPPPERRSFTSISSETSSTTLKTRTDRPITESKNENVITRLAEELEDSGKLEVFPNFYSNYKKIVDIDQRQRYHNDFNKDYEGYTELFKRVQKVSTFFEDLGFQIKLDENNKMLKIRLVREYEKIKKEGVYLKSKHRLNYLHKKLSYIKELVKEFDTLYVQDI